MAKKATRPPSRRERLNARIRKLEGKIVRATAQIGKRQTKLKTLKARLAAL